MPRVEFDLHTRASPGDVVELLTDFSPARPQRWPALAERWYEVYAVGDTSADVRDGGSNVHGTWQRGATTLKGRAVLALMSVVGRRVLSDYFRKAFDQLADQKSA